MDIHLPENALKLIAKTGSKETPVIIPIIVDKDAKPLYCFPNVYTKIEKQGGSMICGWALWGNEMLFEAEFHSVWKSPKGELIDITPHDNYDSDHILFLPDSSIVYEGQLVDNIRINNMGNPLVDDFIKVSEFLHRIRLTGEKVDYDFVLMGGAAILTNFLIDWKSGLEKFILKGKRSKDSCFCGRPFTYENCHGKEIDTNHEMLFKQAIKG
jgi:hypothetical protein